MKPYEYYGVLFQPALPLRGVTKDARAAARAIQFQYAIPLRGVTTGCDRHFVA